MSDLKPHGASSLLHVTLRFLKPKDAPQVKELCEDWFPIKYPSIWYKWITKTNKFYALAALQDSMIVGLIVAQTKPLLDINPEDQNVLLQADLNGGNIGYILTLGVRKPYRRLGLASLLLNQYIEHVRLDYHIKCQPASIVPSFLLTSTQAQSQTSHGSNGSIHVQQEESLCDSNVALYNLNHSATNGASSSCDSNVTFNNLNNSASNDMNSKPANPAASKQPLVTPASEIIGSAHALSSLDQRPAHVNRSTESYITLQFDGLASTDIPLTDNSYFTSVDSQLDAEVGASFRGELMNVQQIFNGGHQNSSESLRLGSIPQQNNKAKTCGPVILNINLEDISSSQILEEPSSIQDKSDARHIRISISDLSDATEAKDEWNDLRLSIDVRPPSALKSTRGADINSNILTPTYSCSVPVCAAASRPHAEPLRAFEAAGDGASTCGGHAEHSVLSPAGAFAAPAAGTAGGGATASARNGCSSTPLTDPHSAEQVPTICSSYVVESEVTQRDVLERLQCCSPTHATAPVTALLLHVLSSNGPAIAFYSRCKFVKLAFLPMFYTINDVAQDGYSYVFYLNGSRAPSSFFANPLGALTLPGTSGALGSLSSVRARVTEAVARWVVGDMGSRSNIVGTVMAGMVGVFERMVATLVGADSR